jgi:hypothetical protein
MYFTQELNLNNQSRGAIFSKKELGVKKRKKRGDNK